MPGTTDDVAFECSFDLTGYDPATFNMDIEWAVDNGGTVNLNGVFKALPAFGGAHCTGLTAVNIVGVNMPTFVTEGDGSPDGFRAAVTVTAEAAPIPATLPLLMGAAGLLARRRGG